MIILLAPYINDKEYHLLASSPKKSVAIDFPEPIWFQQRHPFITTFFYGKAEKMPEDLIPTLDIKEAIAFLEEKYYINFIVHAPKDYLVYFDAIYEHIYQAFSPEKLKINKKETNLNKPFIYHQQHFYSTQILAKTPLRKKEEIRNFVKQNFTPSPHRPLSQFIQNPQINMLPIGGWCGPMVALLNMGLRLLINFLPFNSMHTTMACLCEIISGNKDAIYQLGINSLTPHDDIVNEPGKAIMEERLARFYALLKSPKPNLYIRTIISQNFETEFKQAIKFMKILENKFKRNDRMLLLLHDQKIGTVKIKMLQPNMMVWAAQGQVGWNVPNRLTIFRNYTKAIEYALAESNWTTDNKHIKSPIILPHNSKGICKTLFDINKKKVLQKVQTIQLAPLKRIPNSALFLSISNKEIISNSFRGKDKDNRNQRLLQLVEKVVKNHQVPDGTFLMETNDESFIDYKFPYFAYAKRKSDPRPISLMPVSTRKKGFLKNLKDIYQYSLMYPWTSRNTNLFATDDISSPLRAALEEDTFEFYFGREYNIPFKKHCEYQYTLAIEGNGPNYLLPELFMTGCCVIILEEKGNGFEMEFLRHLTPNRDYKLVAYEKGASIKEIKDKIKLAIETEPDGHWIAKNGQQKAHHYFIQGKFETIFAQMLNRYSKWFEQGIFPNDYSYYKENMDVSQYFYNSENDFVN